MTSPDYRIASLDLSRAACISLADEWIPLYGRDGLSC